MSVEGYSYYQKGSLDALAAEVEKKSDEVEKKVVKSDYENNIAVLDQKDASHFTRIEGLKNTKVVLNAYTDKMSELDGTDVNHHTQLNNLDTNYGNKASKMVFDNTVLELRALDENHDMRLDELEKRFSTIHTDLYETVVQELGQKIDSAEFNQMISQINVGQTGLAQDIAGLLLESQMINANAGQDAAIALKADKAEFDTATADISSRHLDIEKRLLAVDQFFRLMSKTYKIYDNAGEIKYTANMLPVQNEPTFEVIGRKTLIQNETRSLFRSSLNYVDNVVIKMTNFGYNTLTGSISIFNQAGDVVGTISKEDVNPLTKNADIPLTVSSFDSIQVTQVSSDNTPLFSQSPITASQFSSSIPDLTPLNIISTNTSIDSFINTAVSLQNDIQGTGTITCVPALPTGLTAVISNRKLIISGQTSQVISSPQNYTLTVSNSINSQNLSFTMKFIEREPTYTYNASYTYTKTASVNIAPTLTSGDAATSWSISPALPANSGLTFNSSTGAITGTANNTLSTTTFTVTYGNSGGSKNVSFTITVNPRPPLYTYSPSSVSVKVSNAVNITPSLSAGNYDAATTWSISPTVSASTGLTFNTSTGVLSGTAAAVLATTSYTVSYSNSGGNNTATFSLTIDPLYKGLAKDWIRYFKNTDIEQTTQANFITVDSSGNIYTDVSNFPRETPFTSSIQKISPTGGEPVQIYKAPYIYGMTIDTNNNLYVISNTSGIVKILNNTTTVNASYALPSGADASPVYRPIYVDKLTNDIYIGVRAFAPVTFSNLTMGGTFTTNNTNTGIIKLNSSLVPQWGRWIAHGSDSAVRDISTDNSGNVFVIFDNNFNFIPTLTGVTKTGTGTHVAVKFSSAGAVLSSNVIYGMKLFFDNNNDIYTIGNNTQNFSAGTSYGTKSSNDTLNQGYVIKYNSSFTPVWRRWSDTTPNVSTINGGVFDISKGEIYTYERVIGISQLSVSKYSTSGDKIMTLQLPAALLSGGNGVVVGNISYSAFTNDIVISGVVYSSGQYLADFPNVKNWPNIGNQNGLYSNGFVANLIDVNI